MAAQGANRLAGFAAQMHRRALFPGKLLIDGCWLLAASRVILSDAKNLADVPTGTVRLGEAHRDNVPPPPRDSDFAVSACRAAH